MKTKAEINQRINLLKLLKSKYFNAKEFEIGTQIMVKWKKDGNFYPATIKRLVEKERKKFKSTFFNGISTNKERKKTSINKASKNTKIEE